MYGLMQAGICSRNRERAYQRRLHYCGTCKTIGRMYGQKSRLLLNNDAVFLAELLTAIGPAAPPVGTWSRAFQSVNCLALPRDEGESPLALQVAAAATLVMSEFKVADQLDDATRGPWRLAQRVYSRAFCDASAQLRAWDFPLAAMWERYREQAPREAALQSETGARGVLQALEFASEPTAAVTGDTFRHGARVVGAAEETNHVMGRLGFAFGRLVYVLDALEDFGKDLQRGEFNAIQSAFGIPAANPGRRDGGAVRVPQASRSEQTPGNETAARKPSPELPASARATTEAYLWETAGRAITAIEALPISRPLAAMFVQRLRANLSRRLGPEPRERISPIQARRRYVERARSFLQARQPQLAGAGGGLPPGHFAEEGGGTEIATTGEAEGEGQGNLPAKRGGRSGCGGSNCACCCDGCDGCDCACCACESCDICSGCGEACGGCSACGDACSGCGDCCSGCGSCVL
ncbi:MAG TPA: DUF5685 family protein [Chthonomonadaceae bacterium]|nr:DUF5685 family protein [Chthonomonadaceae bacterium]